MARKKKKSDEDQGQRPTATQSYDEDAGGVKFKDGNEEGLSVIVKISEEVNVEQDHYAKVGNFSFNGSLNIENPSTVDRVWDIDLTLRNIENVDLESENIKIQELGITDEDNVDTREFKITGEAQNLLLVKEYINTLPDASKILNSSDLETNILKLKEEDDTEDTTSLESFGISMNQLNNVSFAIAMHSLFEKDINEVSVVKTVPDGFENISTDRPSIGDVSIDGNQITWTIDELEPESTAILIFTADIQIEEKGAVKTGPIEVNYKALSSFTGGLEIEKFDGSTNNKHYVDMIERDEEPGVWDCNLVFENPSEFSIELFNTDVHSPDEPDSKFVSVDEENPPMLPAGAEWYSATWQYESEDYPSFRKELEFRIFSEIQMDVNGSIAISDIELVLASIGGEVSIEEPDIAIPTEEEGVIALPSYKDADIPTTLKYVNDGSAPLDQVKLTQKGFDDKFRPPKPDEVEVFVDGKPIDVDPENIIIDDDSVQVILPNLKDSPEGMLEPDSVVEVKYPIHAESPPEDTEFITDVIYNGNTYPLGQELEYLPTPEEIPVIKILHIRRKYRLGKEVVPIGELGNYQIKLHYENLGNMPLKDFVLIDKVPDNFEYSGFSQEPEITDNVGTDTLEWAIDLLDEGEIVEISYDISGSGEYRPSDAQVAF